MKSFLIVFCAAALGAVFGSLTTRRFDASGPSSVAKIDSIETREILILNEENRPAARFKAAEGGALLQFYADGLNPALEMGVGGNPSYRFIRFVGKAGKIVASLNSLPQTAMPRSSWGMNDGWEGLSLGPSSRPISP